jgi:hypothetical protein
VTGGGGVILYDDKPGLGSEIIKRPARRIRTNKDAALSLSNRSNVTLTTGGLSSPASASPLAAKSSTAQKWKMERKNQARNR